MNNKITIKNVKINDVVLWAFPVKDSPNVEYKPVRIVAIHDAPYDYFKAIRFVPIGHYAAETHYIHNSDFTFSV